MSKFGWLATVVCFGMSALMWFITPGMVYQGTGEPATLVRYGIISMGLWPLLIVYKWEWEAYQVRKTNE